MTCSTPRRNLRPSEIAPFKSLTELRMGQTEQPGFRYQPRLWATLSHLLLLGLAYALFAGRKPGFFRSETVISLVPDFYSHISNFSLSFMLYAGAGFAALLGEVPLRRLAWIGVAFALANVVYELFLPLLNTRDPVDAVYGVAGTLLAFVWLMVI